MELSGVASGKPKMGTGQGMQLPDIISSNKVLAIIERRRQEGF
jgi:hypothetical protein